MARRKQRSKDQQMALQTVQASIGMELQSTYKPPPSIPHGLLVLLMQLDDNENAEHVQTSSGPARASGIQCHFT
jgi:hypothetical protein